MAPAVNTMRFRVRYSDTDQMGTFSSDRALDWFEHARTELLRAVGLTYTQVEQRGIFLPVAEGYTIHAFVNADGKPIRPPTWFVEKLQPDA